MRLDEIPVGDESPIVVNAVVEIPRGSSNKYEYNTALDAIVLDRALYSPLFYPAEYGWVAGTLSEDGDPLDVLVLSSYPTFPGCVIRARPIGVLHMRDEQGEDYKIIASAVTDPHYKQVQSMDDVPKYVYDEIEAFFSVYKVLEGKNVDVLGWKGVDDAHRIITESVARRNETQGYDH